MSHGKKCCALCSWAGLKGQRGAQGSGGSVSPPSTLQGGMQQGSGSGSHIPSYSGWGQWLFTVQSYFKADFKNINKRGEEQMPPSSELCFYAIRRVKAACPGCVLYLPVFESRLLSVSEVEVGQDLWTWCPLPPAEENTDSV